MKAKKKILTEEFLEEIVRRIVKAVQPEKIILFGSYAWGKPNKDSDVDLFIIKETDNTRKTAMEIDRSIFPRPFPIDLLVYTPKKAEKSVNENRNLFVEDILRNGKILYTNPKSVFSITLPQRPLTILH